MRQLVLLATLLASTPAAAADSAIEIGAHAGVWVFDSLDQLTTSWYLTPRLGFWFNHGLGLEIDVGVSTGAAQVDGHNFLMVAPQINFIGNPIKESANAPVWPILTLGGGMLYKTVDAAGVQGERYAFTRYEGMASFGTGVIIPIVGPLHARTDVRMVMSGAPNSGPYNAGPLVNFEWTAGLSARFGLAKDADKDRIPDKIDLCVDDPEDKDGYEDDDGCPDTDNDSDGVLDGVDGCPNEAEDLDGFEDANGCPDTDNDGDGILDVNDECPDEPGDARTNGCPDRDGDLIPDKDDRCPEKAGVFEGQGCPDTDGDGLYDPDDECPEESGPIEAFGCPDRDTDRVPTYRDACPDEPAAADVDPLRSDGCPSRVYVALGAIKITETVYFATGKDVIRSTSFGLLDDIAAVLNKYPEILKVQVEGHTDSQGDDASNLVLSQKRAEAVVKYLTEKGGVDGSRLVALGYGETKPIEDNKTSAGRAKNRRVAFVILEQKARVAEIGEAIKIEAEREAELKKVEEAEDTPAE